MSNKTTALVIGIMIGFFLALCVLAMQERKNKISFAHDITSFTVSYFKLHGYYPSYQIQEKYATADGLEEKTKLWIEEK